MKIRRCLAICIVLACCYCAGPYLAGALKIGDRLGPVIYPRDFHTSLFIIAYESQYHEKPRAPRDSWMYRRPLFYGLPRRLKSPEERSAFIEMVRKNNSPGSERLIEMNEKVK